MKAARKHVGKAGAGGARQRILQRARRPAHAPRRNVGGVVLSLSLEEALGLLDIALIAPCELTRAQQTAVEKLGDSCRRSTVCASKTRPGSWKKRTSA